ncbi:biotin/lipoyl-containing protein [Escherichia coli]|uniref:biotin/lipoyl-containing protein n=1 Tax=Escherichia coli TaxID=562 RepID=UPI0034D5201E
MIEGQVVAIVESMKMEVAVTATEDGMIEAIDCAPGVAVVAGQRLMVLKAGAAEEVA